ncbi:hypothetical protein RBS60_14740 [Sinomonas sp. ASV486]|uniref:hypothetical protein n=1 Tax=Sinomonas sp. ASV486 TaxID=3051170 RepID=UPI0027DD718E|nr:hypothetical protein [Sinomonas sp. ASV486]MDQ4491456.1 hypothetical protein [Sinomonas sp. ASV486]
MASDNDTRSRSTTSAPPGELGLEASLADLGRAIHAVAHTSLLPRLIDVVLRHPPETFTARWLVAAGALDAAVRLLIPVVVTTVAGAWADAPLWSWAIVDLYLTADYVISTATHPRQPPIMEDFLALSRTLEQEADVRRLNRLTRRWLRLPVRVALSILLAAPILAMSMIADPRGLTSIHVGSAAMAAAVLYEFSEIVFFQFIATTRLLRSEARYSHRLSWLSPADTPGIPRMLHAWGTLAVLGGGAVVFYMLPVILLVAPGTAAFLVGLVAAMTLSGYLVTIASYVSVRSSVRAIVRHHKQRTLERLQHRIDGFGPRMDELTPPESQRLQGLMATYAAVRDAPLMPRSSEAGSHALAALAVPGIGFFLAVLAEVYAERLLTQLVP